nr:peptidase [Lachnospiraceae bacterium]
QKYKGSAPGSEAETAALIRRTKELNPVLAVSYHASGSVIYWDYGQTGELRTKCNALVDTIHSVNRNEIRYAATDKQDAAGYGDWLVMAMGIPSATIEIGVGAAPLASDEFMDIWERNAAMWAALADFAMGYSQ